jgi:hypothetical protein
VHFDTFPLQNENNLVINCQVPENNSFFCLAVYFKKVVSSNSNKMPFAYLKRQWSYKVHRIMIQIETKRSKINRLLITQ